jgi:hypothetical protein
VKPSRRPRIERVNLAWCEPASGQSGWPQSTVIARALPSIYASFGPFLVLDSDKRWARAAVIALETDGAEQFLANLLHILRQTFAGGD